MHTCAPSPSSNAGRVFRTVLLSAVLCVTMQAYVRAAAGPVAATGSYETGFDIPVPPAPAAPKVALTYNSAAGGTLAGVGWDLSVGWPTSIVRDVRFGTVEWKLDSAWLWGTSPLVPKAPALGASPDPFDCAKAGERQYRIAPDGLACIAIDLTVGQESARVRLATGTTLHYEPILYDGIRYPAAPAGNQTTVLGFRLSSVVDSNGYRTCFTYKDFGDTQRGKVGVVEQIAYGPTPLATNCSSAAFGSVHRIVFEYADTVQSGFFAAWTLRFGAPVSFRSLLERITVFAAGQKQDEFTLEHEGKTSETRQPRLVRIDHTVQDSSGRSHTRTVRTYTYGERRAQFDGGQVLELGDLGTFPASIAGTVSRPMRRSDLLDNPLGIGQIGQDVGTALAPVTHATTEQWALMDLNGDGLPDFQWGREKGADLTAPGWPTFEAGLTTPVSFSNRPPQQLILVNDGIAGSRLATSPMLVDSHAPSLENQYVQGMRDPEASPVDPQIDGFSPWFWGDGQGMTRTGMPVSVSAAEIANAAPTCPLGQGQDSRLWPRYPDGTDRRSPGSIGATLAQPNLLPAGVNTYFGNPVLGIIEGIYKGYHPTYSVSSALSAWVDLNGDGVQEFVATPGWIERFSIEFGCQPVTPSALLTPGPGQHGARQAFPAARGSRATGYTTDTDWHRGRLGSSASAATGPLCTAGQMCLDRVPGPPGLVGLPISYETSTAAAETVGITLPIGGSVMAGLSAALGGGWMAIAAAAPGLSVDVFTPRTAPGYRTSVDTPSATGLMQGMGNVAYSNASAGSIAGFIMSAVRTTFDLTLLSAKNQNRSETRAQLMDVNADGLPDYVLYNSGTHGAGDPLTGIAPGDLVVFLNSPSGTFGPPMVMNAGFGYLMAPPNVAAIESILSDARILVQPLNNPLLAPDKMCYATGPVACAPFIALIAGVAAKGDEIITRTEPFLTASADVTRRERTQVQEIKTLVAALKGMAVYLLGAGTPMEVDTTTAAARAVVENLGHLARTVRQIGHASRISVVGEGFAELDGGWIGQSADGIAAQTRGFVDLNGDALPDYVVTADREAACPVGTWQVFWGTGTSSGSARRAFLATPSCIPVPSAPSDVVAAGFATLPLNVDRVQRAATGSAQSIDTVAHAYVSLDDFNRDGRPDLVIAGSAPWDATASARTWQVFLNTGSGFELTPSLTVASPATTRTDVEPASSVAAGMNVPYPVMRTTRTVSNVGASRDTSETHATIADIDGDGSEDVVRRVRLLRSDGSKREGLLVWRRPESGPQDVMIEERLPLQGRRALVEYKPAPAFQWRDANPNGQAPPLGHQSLSGIPGRLVRSVTTEPLLGRPEQRTRHGYDYKLPYFDQSTRMPAGFAIRTNVPLDPVTGTAIDASVEESERTAQRPDAVPGVTHSRRALRGSGAPVQETLKSYAEAPTATGGIGGLKAVFSAPTRTFVVEYPGGVTRGPIFDLGFEGRQAFRDRAAGRDPLSTTALPTLDPLAATGGAAQWLPASTAPIRYASPHTAPGSAASPLSEATVEAWVRPLALTGGHTIAEQPGAYRLGIVAVGNEHRFRLEVPGAPGVTASGAIVAGRWNHVVATFGRGAGRIFVNGIEAGSEPMTSSPTPVGNLLVGCADVSSGSPLRCFVGSIGELRIYPEAWTTAPRITDTESELQVTDPSRVDFGQALRVLTRNDMTTADDDVLTEYEYARPVSSSQIFGLAASEAQRELLRDGTTVGRFLAYSERLYDGLPFGQVGAGNLTRHAKYDGASPPSTRPTSLRVVSQNDYLDPLCPGRITQVTDPAGFTSETTWDPTCTFAVQARNALGQVSRTNYYRVNHLVGTPPAAIGGAHGVFPLVGRYGQQAESVDANQAVTRSTFDEWGRPRAVWAPLDRRDRPGVRYEYADASCEERVLLGGTGGSEQIRDIEAPCAKPTAFVLHSPARTTTFTWDDQLRRCQTAAGVYMACSSPSATKVADEPGTGAYRLTHAFGDGQTQAQALNDGTPDWTVVGTSDFDPLGRVVRQYKIRYLPRQPGTGLDPCPNAGEWCDSARLTGDPLRRAVAAVQVAYDAQGRKVRIYGPEVPRCQGDPSTLGPTGEPACDALVPTGAAGKVTRISYPSPGTARTTDANGVPTAARHDARGLLAEYQEYLKSSPQSYATVRWTYDRMGRIESITDQNGNVSRSQYDALSRPFATEDPDLGRTTNAYDVRSQLVERIVASGEKTTHQYDPLGRVTQTDYLRPKSVPSLPVCCNLPDEIRVRVFPDDVCQIVPGFSEPTRFMPGQVGPPPPVAASPLPLTRGDLDDGEAETTLPFDLVFDGAVASAPTGDGTRRPGLTPGLTSGTFRFPSGTRVTITTDGRIRLSNSIRIGPRQIGIDGTLDVFGANLVLREGGLRTIAGGSEGSRTLIIEWEGALAARREDQVLVRAILSEEAPALRYEYVRVPARANAGVGMSLKAGPSAFALSAPPREDDRRSAAVDPGTTLIFHAAGGSTVRMSCNRGPARIEIPIDGGGLKGDRLHVGYRLFSDCDAQSPEQCADGALRVLGRSPADRDVIRELGTPGRPSRPLGPRGDLVLDGPAERVPDRNPSDGGAMHELGTLGPTPRPLDRQGDLARESPDGIDFTLPAELRGRAFTLVLEHQASGRHAGRPFVLDVASVNLTQTVYEPEERVLRTYDTSEPAYFHQATATGGLVEARPVLDLSFDVAGRAADRSPSGAPVTCTGTAEDVVGASGRGIRLAPGAECRATGLPGNLTALTAELWLRPSGYPAQPQSILSVDSQLPDFSVGLLPDGRVWCGPTSARVFSQVGITLPTDAWSHVGLVYDGRRVRCAVNGAVQGSTSAPTGGAVISSLRIAGGSGGVAVDGVRLIGAARSEQEILEDALRPLTSGAPRGNLVHVAFSLPSTPGADASKAGNHARLVGGGIVPGIQGMTFGTDGGARIEVPHSPTLGLVDRMTAEVWLKTKNGAGGPARLIGKWRVGAPGWRLDLQASSGRLRWEVLTEVRPAGGGPSQIRRAVFVTYEQVNDDAWHHVAGTYDGRRLRVFIDGVPAHRWCSDETSTRTDPCTDPPAPTACAIETMKPDGAGLRALGDAVCVEGSIDNPEPILVANDLDGAAFDGFLDEVRVSNYAKREFEVAASARLASAYTQSLGRETALRNQLPVGDGLERQVARERRGFDLQGRAASWLKHVRGQRSASDFMARVVPDTLGRPGLLEYPHGEVVANGFSLGGVHDAVIGYGPGIGSTPSQAQAYVARATSTVTGRIGTMLYGNGVGGTWAYEDAATAAGGFGPDTLKTSRIMSSGGVPLSDRVYQWDAVRSLRGVSDTGQGAMGFEATYGHDDLRRISSATLTISGQTSSYAYGYDSLGNLRTKEGATQDFGRPTLASACPATTSALPHALTRRTIGGAPDYYCYDLSGRLLRSTDTPKNSIRTFQYFARGKVSRLSDRNGAASFAYDGDGLRVWKSETGSAQTIPFAFFRELPSASEATYSRGAQLVARRVSPPNPDLVWYSTDHLDGTNFLTGSAGSEVPSTRAYYRPFGEFAGAPPQAAKAGGRQFTSKELDASGLYDFGARPYDPATGAFTQADEITVGSSAQSLNRYSYVLNGPLAMVDPSGHAPVDTFVRWVKEADSDEGSVLEHLPKRTSDLFSMSCHLNWNGCSGGPPPVKPPRTPLRVQIADFDEGEHIVVPTEDYFKKKSDLMDLNDKLIPDQEAAAELSRQDAKSAGISALPGGMFATGAATAYDLYRGDPAGAGQNVGEELAEKGGEKGFEKLGAPSGPTNPASLAFSAWDTWKLHKAMRAHGKEVQKLRDLKRRRYDLMREFDDPDARLGVPGALMGPAYFLGPDGRVYRVDGKPLLRY